MRDKPGYQMYAFPYLFTDEEGGEARAYERTIPVAEEGGEVVLRRIHDTDSHHLPHEATFFQRGLVERVGGYSEGFRWHVDLDFFCRALRKAPLWLFTEPRIVVYRFHQGMVSRMDATTPPRERAQRHWEHLWARLHTGASPFGKAVRTHVRGYLREAKRRLMFWRS